MKLKPNQRGFSVVEIVLVIVVLAALGAAGWYVSTHHKQAKTQPVAAGYTPGLLWVTFKDGTTSQQALALVSSYKVSAEDTKQEIYEVFTPVITQSVQRAQYSTIAAKLQQSSDVTDVQETGTPDPPGVTTSDDAVTVTFKQTTTSGEVKNIMYKAGAGSSSFMMFRRLTIKVPAGQESAYISKFQKNSLVQSAEHAYPDTAL